MLTRLLHSCGLNLGAEQDLMAPAADNPDGFWENLRLVKLNDEILNALGASWDLPPSQDESFRQDQLQPIRSKAQLLIESFDRESPWGWKDPRNCLTLPFWRDLLPSLRTVIIVRNPLEVAYSMHKRNGTSYVFGMRLWEIYNQHLIEHAPADTRIITHYQFFFEHPEAELRRIAAFAGLPDTQIEEVARLVAHDRRHTSFTTEQLIDAGASKEIVAIYRSLIDEAAERGASSSTKPSSPRRRKQPTKRQASTTGKVDPLAGTVNRLNVGIPDGETVRQELASRRGAEIQYRNQLGKLESQIQALSRELASTSLSAAGKIGTRDGRIAEMEATIARIDQMLQREQAQRRADRNEYAAELEKLRAQLTEQKRSAYDRLVDKLAELDKLRERLSDQSNKANERFTRDAAEIDKLRKHSVETKQLLDSKSKALVETKQLLDSKSKAHADYKNRNASLTEQLRKQLLQVKNLMRLLEESERAADRLRHSRRWLIANPMAWLKARLAGRSSPGFGHLDKVVEKYKTWRAAHPEVAQIDEALQALQLPSKNSQSPQIPEVKSITKPPPAEPPPTGKPQSIAVIDPPVPQIPIPPIPPIPIQFPIHNQIEVSIIIPVFNQLNFTQACLASLQEHSDDIAFEVIVVDDCSTDATKGIVPHLPGVVYLRNDTNAGFIASCNRGAKAARGKYLVFLNNDTTVTNGWLASLLETFQLEPQAGLVGSKLIYPDGRLQEAGGIIWRDGSGWNRGKFQDAGKPEYNYLKQVDYCSAASVMIPKKLFESLGGFDAKYAPAYYEDTDLAFRVAQNGLKVLYQPLSVVVHYEGITGGTDIFSGTKSYQKVNQTTFTASWAEILAGKPEKSDIISYEKPRAGTKRILVIDHLLPMPDRDSGSLRMFQILNILHRLGHRVTFIPDNLVANSPYADELRKRGIEVIHSPYIKTVRDYLQAHGAQLDVVILSRCNFARKHIGDVRSFAPQSRIIFDTVDLHFRRDHREAELAQDPELERKARERRQFEYELIDQADETWVVSPVEQELLHLERPEKSIEVVSNIVSVPGSGASFSQRRDILFIGSFQHPPNIDAVVFFAHEIFPLVRERLPGVKFYVIGDKAPPAVLALADEDIVITGFVADVSFYFNTIKLSVAPLRVGAGVKGKINQSMSFGLPVVATSIAVEGMSLTNGEDILIADTPEDFAGALVNLYQSEELWSRISINGLEKTKTLYSCEVAEKELARLFSESHLHRLSAPDVRNGTVDPNLQADDDAHLAAAR